MSTNTEIVEPTLEATEDLDAFSAEFFGETKEEPAKEEAKESEKEEKESDAQTEDTHDDGDDDTPAPDDDDETGEEEEPSKDETPKPKKNRFQERIDEVIGEKYAAERRAQELEKKLTEALQKLEQNTKTEPEPEKTDTGPTPLDKNEDGTDKYPLGEYDPKYLQDVIRHTLQEERKARAAVEKEEEARRARDQAQAELQQEWNSKLTTAREKYPDFNEKGQQLLGTFEGIDAAYGEYLTTTLMEMEYGPDVFYYLASNPDEAHKIVNSGAKKATIALGHIEAKFAAAAEEKQRARPKVSNAPPPPEHLAKGSSAAMPSIPDDTDDLDAFSKKFFSKKG